MKIVADKNIPFVSECFSSIGDIKAVPGNEIRPGTIADTDILLVRTIMQVNSDLLANSKIRFVGAVSTGFEHVDIDYLQRNNIGFSSAPGSNSNSVAEYIVAALLSVAKDKKLNLQNKSIGVIGVGNIGSKVAKKAAALGMRIYLNDPLLQRRTHDEKYLPLNDLFDCDFITLHTPLTFQGQDKTFHLADEVFFKSLKHDCVFINTSRGGVVDTNALKTAIKSDKFKSVVLDVWENEPNIDSELCKLVDIATPHIAGYSLDGRATGTGIVYRAVCKHFGLDYNLDLQSFLPKPAVSQLKINPQPGDEQDIIIKAVEQVYRIKEDDSQLRKILTLPAIERNAFFGQLRKNYPVRREFNSLEIILESNCKSLADKLAGLGFEVTNEAD
ncbi:MAG: 4-phosphoerythronate dehydrogenase [Planctomycetes bacterium]|nr:4-phosphoerythronate dehydrogenase [Planctomycetota bacterium]